MADNNILYQSRLHWIIFIGPTLLFAIMAYLSLTVVEFRLVTNILVLASIVWGITVGVNYYCSLFSIETKQVILCTGFLMQQSINVPLSKIESIDIRQSLLGSLLKYGSLVITGTGGTRQAVDYLNNPLTCRRYIEQAINNL